MRRRFFVFTSLVLSATSFAGTVVFEPSHVSVQPGDVVPFQISVGQTDLVFFDTVFMVVDFDPLIPLHSFEYADSFVAQTTLPVVPPFAFCFGPWCPLAFGGNDFAAPFFVAPLLIGELNVRTEGLAPGTYEILVNAGREAELIGSPLSGVAFGGGNMEGLEGRATFTVIPEPTCLSLLVCGALGIVARRRA